MNSTGSIRMVCLAFSMAKPECSNLVIFIVSIVAQERRGAVVDFMGKMWYNYIKYYLWLTLGYEILCTLKKTDYPDIEGW